MELREAFEAADTDKGGELEKDEVSIHSLDSNDREIYNPATSQDPVWGETDIFQIIARAVEIMGVSMQVGAVVQYAEQIKNNGQ